MLKFIYNIPRRLVVFVIRIYQKTISFDHGVLKIFYPNGFCRFTPSCSEYSAQAITKYGVIKGGLMASWRILRCNPWSKGGHDPLK
ncbi:membrane protein insertion efficiency factor YidD [Candidatus Falkowbacteria bacterium]|jgi:putative membrane protein insertion efficiency factor|nr:membrane protein insertion efficiency factor YidD [Candidatus Falkowbacteria bacterium]